MTTTGQAVAANQQTSTNFNKKVFYKGSDLEAIAKRKGYTITTTLTDKKTKKGNPYYAFVMSDQTGKVILARNAIKYLDNTGSDSFLVFREEYDEKKQQLGSNAVAIAQELGISLD